MGAQAEDPSRPRARCAHPATRSGTAFSRRTCALGTRPSSAAFTVLLDQLRAELAPSSLLESLIVERIAAGLWRTRRVLAFESSAALERDTAPEPDAVR